MEAENWLEGTDEDGGGFVDLAGDDVEAEVHAVGEVDVGSASASVHGFVARSAPTGVGVGGTVLDADVGFGFDDAADEECAVVESACESAAEERACDDGRRASEPAMWEAVGDRELGMRRWTGHVWNRADMGLFRRTADYYVGSDAESVWTC